MIARCRRRPVIAGAVLALCLAAGAGISVPGETSADPGVFVGDGGGAGVWTRDGGCVDDSARLIAVGDGVFRCEGGMPVPRPQPWNSGGCGSVVLAPGDDDGVVWPWIGDACLVGAAASHVSVTAPEAGR